jgi:hypothetical protein
VESKSLALQGFRFAAANAAERGVAGAEELDSEFGNYRYIPVRILPIIPLPPATP